MAGAAPASRIRSPWVARRFWLDRYEAVLLGRETGLEISAYYPPSRRAAALCAVRPLLS